MFVRGEKLGVVEGDDLRPASGQQIQLEVRRDVDCGDRPPGADRSCSALQISRPFGDAQSRGGRDRLDEPGRGFRAVGIDDDDFEPAHDRAAERPGQDGKRNQRNDDGEQVTGTILPGKPYLAQRHQQ